MAGSHSAISGQATSITSSTNISRWNGRVPITTSDSLPREMLWMTNRLMPIGGVIWPISMNSTTMMPNHTGSMPYLASSG